MNKQTKIYDRIVIDIATNEVLSEDSFVWIGDVAECGGGGGAPRQRYSPAGRIVAGLYDRGKGPLAGSLQNILATPGDDPYTMRQADLLTQKVRTGYGARGLATSGIAQQGEQEALSDFLLNRGEQKTNQAISILGTGSSSGNTPPQSGGKGFLGLK